jgi:hypothetical protein
MAFNLRGYLLDTNDYAGYTTFYNSICSARTL